MAARQTARSLAAPALACALALALTLVACGAPSPTPGEAQARDETAHSVLRVNGSTTINPVVTRAAEILRAERGLEITIDTQGGSSGGLAALGEGRAEVAMASRPVNNHDHESYPEVDFRPTRIGVDAVALVVSRDVWEGGVHSLTRDQMRAIYESRVTSWSEVGGPDVAIAFFNKEPGRGTWEVFAHWAYGDPDEAPLVSHLEVGSNEEGRTKVASTPGALTQLSFAWADGETVFPLAVDGEGGEVVAPTPETVAEGRYPISRQLLVVTDGEPSGTAAELVDYLVGPEGQALVEEAGYLPLGDAGTEAPTS